MDNVHTKRSWKYVLGPVIIMVVLATYPQTSLFIAKGSAWRGSYVVSNYDETAYSAYVNALVNGDSRENDPFIGTSYTGVESLYSIQFIPAYAIAIPARLLGLSTSSAFIGLSILLAILSSLALFWFLLSVTEDSTLAAVGALLVMCLGTAAAFQGELSVLVRGNVLIDFFPFLRRYQPGFAFPLFFVFCVLVWRSFGEFIKWKTFLYASGSGTCFGVLVFSYFYLWTAAAAWLACFTVLAFFGNPERRKGIFVSLGIIAVFAVIVLVPYARLLAERSLEIDSVQLLARTHMPDLLHPTLVLGVLIIVALGIQAYLGRISLKEPSVLLALSFAATPFLLFNQQVLTGRSLQPVHYEIFIGNYLVLVAIVLILGSRSVLSPDSLRRRKILTYVATATVIWGMVEASASTSRNSLAAEIRDESLPAIHLIDSKRPAPVPGDATPVVLATNFITADIVPTVSTLRPLWNAHTSSAGGVGVEENKRLFYLYLYYSGYSENDLAEALASHSFEVTAAVFGSERALPALGSGESIKADEIRRESQRYAEFVKNFGPAQTNNPMLSYLIVPAKAEPNYTNLDRWYQRGTGEPVGLFKVYLLTPKIGLGNLPPH